MSAFRITIDGDYSLSEAIDFWQGFRPGAGTARSESERLILVFRRDRDFAPVGAVLAQPAPAELEVTAAGSDRAGIEPQLRRMLSLDYDAAGWAGVLGRDPVLAALQARWPGFRPVCFPSPWEAAVWGILAQRVPMAIAARVKAKIAAAHGDRIEIAGQTADVFPSPARMLELSALESVPQRKLDQLKGLARAALDGRLDAERLRALPVDTALSELMAIPGVGSWTAGHILFRGAALADSAPFDEPRVRRAIALVYDLKRTPSAVACARRARAWKPYRMWACVLVVRALARSGAWNAGDQRGRTRRGSRS